MAQWFMEVLTGLFSIWASDPSDDDVRDPLASY
jgi:hypothetical protein